MVREISIWVCVYFFCPPYSSLLECVPFVCLTLIPYQFPKFMEFSAVEIDSLCLSRLFAVFPAHTEHWPPFSLCWALQCYLLTQKANEKIPDHYIILWNLTVFLPLSQSSDFSDITNWPTPGELAKEVWYVWMQLLLQAMRACFLVLLLAASKMDLFF